MQLLQLPKQGQWLSITGTQNMSNSINQHAVDFTIKYIRLNNPTLSMSAAVVPRVTCDLPLQETPSIKACNHLKDLVLADPQFDKPGKVNLLIGYNALQDVLTTDMQKGNPQGPMAMRKIFGWAILRFYNPASGSNSSQPALVGHTTAIFTSNDLLKKFGETEEVTQPSICLTPEEEGVV